MADIGNDVKIINKNMENESLNERNSFSGNSANHGPSSSCKFQPVRVKALLDMYESDDDDSEDKDRSSDDDEGASDLDDGQLLQLDSEEKSKDEIKQSDNKSSNCIFSSAIDSKDLKMEILTEESERRSISRESMKNLSDHYISNISNSNATTTVNPMITTVMTTSTTSNFHHQRNDKLQTNVSYSQNNTRSSISKELFHDTNERKLSIGKSSLTGFTSDFGAMDLDSKSIRSVGSSSEAITPLTQCNTIVSNPGQLLSRNKTFDSTGQKLEGNILSNSSYNVRLQPNIKFETPDLMHPSHDRHTHTVTNYKAESMTASSSKYDVPVPTSQSDLLPMTTNYLPVETSHSSLSGSMRPTSSNSHRNIFQTPQNKMQKFFSLNQSHVPTPGTIFSHWSQNNMMHTPMQNKITDSSQTPAKITLPQQGTVWYRKKESKGVRRPLAETTGSEHRISNEISPHGLDIHDSVENSNRPPLEKIQEKVEMQPIINQDSKENKRPLIADSTTKKDELLQRNKILEPVSESRHANLEMIPKSMPADVDPLREHYNNPPAMENKTNIQASVPSSIKKSEHGKVMKVKDREYMILGYLGKGMSGEVVRVQDLTNLELRAIKCVDLSRMDKDSAQSCVQEITMLGKLQAPCIVRMFDYEIRNKMIYVVMEMGDTDLSKFLKSICAEKRLPLTMILYYWTEMLTAVEHIHSNGVIHSDLKPANFLLVRGRLKLIDFGIASSLNADMTSIVKNSTVGTLNYISPEALMDVGESPNHNSKYKISYKSDVWSLGCILYSLVFGHTPFQHIRQQWAKINAITNPASKISFTQPPNSEPIPTVLIDVVRECLQHDPKARPSVTQLLEIRYVPIGKQSIIAPSIPSNILLKIKCSLNDDEWRQFIEIMDHERRNC